MMETFATALFLLTVVHFLADYPLQGDFLSRAKNQTAPIPGIPWWQAMTAHTGIHAGGVYLVTGSLTLALFEWVMHFWIDDDKCRGKITFNQDQAWHIVCKIVYALFLAVDPTHPWFM